MTTNMQHTTWFPLRSWLEVAWPDRHHDMGHHKMQQHAQHARMHYGRLAINGHCCHLESPIAAVPSMPTHPSSQEHNVRTNIARQSNTETLANNMQQKQDIHEPMHINISQCRNNEHAPHNMIPAQKLARCCLARSCHRDTSRIKLQQPAQRARMH